MLQENTLLTVDRKSHPSNSTVGYIELFLQRYSVTYIIVIRFIIILFSHICCYSNYCSILSYYVIIHNFLHLFKLRVRGQMKLNYNRETRERERDCMCVSSDRLWYCSTVNQEQSNLGSRKHGRFIFCWTLVWLYVIMCVSSSVVT